MYDSADKIIALCDELKALLETNGAFTTYALRLLAKLQGESLNIGLEEREDAKLADVAWISTENGAHIPLKDGKSVGGPTKGMDFSEAYRKVKDAEKSSEHLAPKYDSPIPFEKISAEGKNERCKGFAKGTTAGYKSSEKHTKDYGHMTSAEFEKHAQDLLEKACDENIRGYRMKDGSICRFNWQTGEYAKGYPGAHLRSCFYPRAKSNADGKVDVEYARRYFMRQKEKEAYDE